ncbi:MAG TPA: hypothetical protein VGM59_08775 [Dongiaceae bacterium]
MKFITDRMHGILDYAVVIIFALAPSLMGIDGPSAWICYLLAAVHLAMTVLTDMPLGVVKAVPLKLHGFVELIVALALIAVAWIFAQLQSGQLFFTLMGAVIFFVWVSSNYGDAKRRIPA